MKYPMHDKLKAQAEPHQWCSEFYEYLTREGAVPEELAEMHLAGFFQIDLDALKKEVAAILATL